ncbi:MAG: M23 family metallopeptidase [bacterium]
MKKLNLFNLVFLVLFFQKTAIGLDVKFFKDKFLTGKTLAGLVKDKNKEISDVQGNFMGAAVDFFPGDDGRFYCIKGINIYAKGGEYPFLLNIQYKNGEKEAIEYKFLIEGRKIEKKEEIKIPDKKIKDITKENLANEDVYISNIIKQVTEKRMWWSNFIMPVEGVITSSFDSFRSINNGLTNFFHLGLDIACPEGTQIKASNCGEAVLTEKLISRGNTVIINHGQGIFSVYYHLSKVEVKEKDFVKKGDLIGLAGQTGMSTGPHLHFGIFANRTAVDPEDWLQGSIEKFIFDHETAGLKESENGR